ncbi:MAG TPA: gluconate 2-dehydrogenase subunit 3 family protein [Polyangiales bacterium]|nr:gluconate 2-dehydrogenase subunit 3 family protein [Polyangiales bacterium]
MSGPFFDPRSRVVFAAAAECIVPSEPRSPGANDPRCLALAEAAIALRPAADQKLLRTFLRLVELLPLLRYGRRFSRLSLERRQAVLRWLSRTRLSGRLRAGMFGVKNFALLGYYGSELPYAELGYPGPRLDAPYYTLRERAQ